VKARCPGEARRSWLKLRNYSQDRNCWTTVKKKLVEMRGGRIKHPRRGKRGWM
jgi:hypothetical protein